MYYSVEILPCTHFFLLIFPVLWAVLLKKKEEKYFEPFRLAINGMRISRTTQLADLIML